MPNRDWTWPQGNGKMTGKWMWSCNENWVEWKNIPFGNWQGKRCWKWMKRWLWNRWRNLTNQNE